MRVIRVGLGDDVCERLGKTPREIDRELRLAAAVRWSASGALGAAAAAEVARVGEDELRQALAALRSAAERPAADAAAVRYAVALFGNPTLHRREGAGPQVEVTWRLRRAFETIAFLALAPDRRASKEELVEAVWSDVASDAVRKNFHPTLTEARRSLGGPGRDALVFRQGFYLLRPELEWRVDALRFERLAAAGRELLEGAAEEDDAWAAKAAEILDLWQRAWRLYRGPLLAETDSAWVVPRRESLRREYLRLLRDVGDLSERLGRETLAVDAYRSVLLEEPYEERVHLAMMQLYARQGRRDLVRRQYVKLQELLLKELNVEPLEEIQERYHQLMR